jgi:hypothetical protein
VATTNQDSDRHAPREVELKLGLPSAIEYVRLREALDAAGGIVCARQQENLFFEGANDELSSACLALRVRIERVEGVAQAFVTLKTGGVSDGVLTDRAEGEGVLPPDVASVRAYPSSLLGLELEPIRQLLGRMPGLTGLRLLGGFFNDRRVYCVPLDLPEDPTTPARTPTRVETFWELDRSEFADGAIDHELEVELGHLPSPGAAVAAIHAELARFGVGTVRQTKS